MNKEELSEELNDLLGLVDLDFSKMTKEDLEALLRFFGDPYNLIKIGVKNLRGKVKREILEEVLGRPLIEEVLGRSLEEKEEDRGPLGFGVIPSVLARMRGIFKEKVEG